MKKLLLFAPTLLLFAFALQAPDARAGVPRVPILEVSPDLYRGERPTLETLTKLKVMGVTVDLDLENDSRAIAHERKMANQLGLLFISMPLSSLLPPKTSEVDEILGLLANSYKTPTFVHCEHGQDRTGLIIGLYRVLYEGWAPAEAYSEMLRLGFHKELIFLNHYFEETTRYED